MTSAKEVKLECLRLSNGNIDNARAMFDWVLSADEFESGFRDGLNGLGQTGASERYGNGNDFGSELRDLRRKHQTEPVASLNPGASGNLKSFEIPFAEGQSADEPAHHQEDKAEQQRIVEVEPADLDEFMQRPGAIKHDGRLPPIVGNVLVEYVCRDLDGGVNRCLAQIMRWTHEGWRDDVIAYRIIEPAREDSEAQFIPDQTVTGQDDYPQQRVCTCHPDEAPVPCQQKLSLRDCQIAAAYAALDASVNASRLRQAEEVADCNETLAQIEAATYPQDIDRIVEGFSARQAARASAEASGKTEGECASQVSSEQSDKPAGIFQQQADQAMTQKLEDVS
jgi:hypothetical protein